MSTVKDLPEELLFSIEAIMVNQFRVCQSLRTLTQEERQVLLELNADALMPLVEKKEALLDELGKLEDTRRMLTDKLAQLLTISSENDNLSEILARVKSPAAERVNRIREGILAIQGEISEMNKGNFALASLNLERLGAIQGLLVNLFSSPQCYQPDSAVPPVEPPASWGMDHKA